MPAVARLLLPRALPAAAAARRARCLRAAPLRRRSLAVAAARAAMEAVRFGPDSSVPGYITGPLGAPGVIMMQECARRCAASSAFLRKSAVLCCGAAALTRCACASQVVGRERPGAASRAAAARAAPLTHAPTQVKSHAERLAKAGFRVLIPDIYKGAVGVDKEEASHLMGALDWCAALRERRTHTHTHRTARTHGSPAAAATTRTPTARARAPLLITLLGAARQGGGGGRD
jgi:hypothetical protein